MNLADPFFAHADKFPDQRAFVIDDDAPANAELATAELASVELTYGELAQSVRYLQHYLLSAGAELPANRITPRVAPRIAWVGANDVRLPALYLACVSLGQVLLLLDSQWPESIYNPVVRRLKPQLVITPAIPAQVQLETLPDSTLLEAHRGSAGDPFLIGFTSGSTGGPKAFVRSQGSWLETHARSGEEFGASKRLRVLAPGPLSHGLSFYSMAETLNSGGTFYSRIRFNAARCWQLINSAGVDTLVAVPTMLSALLDHVPADNPAATLQQIVSAGAKLGERLQSRLRAAFPGVSISEYYGASELSFVSISAAVDNPPLSSVGRAFSGVSISIRDSEGLPLPAMSTGTVFVKSKMLADGYIDSDNQLVPLSVLEGGWATVGDIGQLDKNGFLTLMDRTDNMLISGGFNVYPGDIERVLDQHAAVLESVVVGIDDEYWGHRLCAVLRFDESQNRESIPEPILESTLDSIGEHCRLSLAAYQIPRQFFQLAHWPLTSSGKIIRNEVRQWVIDEVDNIREVT